MASRAPRVTAARSVEPPLVTKAQPFFTATPAAPAALDANQRAKMAAVAAVTRTYAEPTAVSAAKPENVSTILAPAPGDRPGSPEAQLRNKLAPAAGSMPEATTGSPRPAGLSAALGVIPRPEWSAGLTSQKPQDVSTIGSPSTAAQTAAAPTAAELQRRATATANRPAGSKAKEVTTSMPRDPSRPADALKATTSGGGKQQVQP
jgi:hypothetical protein